VEHEVVVPRRSAPEPDEDPSNQPVAAHVVEPVATDTAEPVAADAVEPVAAEPETAAEAEAPAEEAAPLTDEAEGFEESQPQVDESEDVPRRARTDDDARMIDDEVVPSEDLPVFQKSATPYWTGASSFAED
jgi:hypothetical protein